MNRFTRSLGDLLASYLSQPGRTGGTGMATDQRQLASCLRAGDVLLVEGTTRVSTAIKYLTQSTWSHAALYVGDAAGGMTPEGATLCFIEADMVHGVRAVGLDNFRGLHCRVCRPVGLTGDEVRQLCGFAVSRLGEQYDMKNVVDLVRYLIPTPPVPARWRRRMLSLGSGDPTRAICSTLLAQCFESIRYPILPCVEQVSANDPNCDDCVREILHVRHYSLYVPRDFDVSPYFQIIRPTLESGFDFHALSWSLASA
jgi:hypothetical protein